MDKTNVQLKLKILAVFRNVAAGATGLCLSLGVMQIIPLSYAVLGVIGWGVATVMLWPD